LKVAEWGSGNGTPDAKPLIVTPLSHSERSTTSFPAIVLMLIVMPLDLPVSRGPVERRHVS